MNVNFGGQKRDFSILNNKVSVIIPVLNAERKLPNVLDALTVQTYPRDLIEVIVVDNGSEDNTQEIAKQYNVNLLKEKKPGPYAARNRGINAATGEILALLDSGTVPTPQWIEEGLRSMTTQHVDLVGGNIVFTLDSGATAGEVFDSITFADNRKLVKEGSAAGGNLFVKKEVWTTIGHFPEQRTGMDIWWTQKATRHGFKLSFSEKAIVHYQPRRWFKTLQKSYRVGTMHPYNMRSSGKSIFFIVWHAIQCFLPQDPLKTWKKMSQLNQSFSYPFFLKVWLVASANKISMGLGRLEGLWIMNNQID